MKWIILLTTLNLNFFLFLPLNAQSPIQKTQKVNCTSDTDNDTVCDVDDICPGFDDLLIGLPCDDGDMCSANDMWTTNCICEGVTSDTDGDGICDVFDICPGPENQCNGYDFSNFSNCLNSQVNGVTSDFSGITYNYDTQTFFTIKNTTGNERIFEIDFDGILLRTITLPNFNDTEGIVYLGNNQFAITEEKRRRIVVLNIGPNITNISYPGSASYIQLTGTGTGNNGLEGLAYDSNNDILYIGKEYSPMAIFVIEHPQSKLGTSLAPIELFDAEILTNTYPSNTGFTDITGLHFTPNGTLFILTHEGEYLVEVQPFTGELINSFDLGPFNPTQAEGITIVSQDHFYIVGEPNEIFSFARTNGICDDGDPCTMNDVFDSSCNCLGVVSNSDSDSDGTIDCIDGCPNDPLKITAGICGCGISDVDSDNDGTVDCNDGCPNDPLKITAGICGCGTSDIDSDSDGTADCNDGCPNDPLKITAGMCGCGTSDIDSDSDGTADCNDGCPNDPLKITVGICGCGTSDVDSDNDGTVDCNDDCPSNPFLTVSGLFGCNSVNLIDTDQDGVPNLLDGCPFDANKTSPDDCGCGIPDIDLDGNGISDCLEPCLPNLYIASYGTSYELFEAGISITSDGVIDSSDVDLSAGDFIELQSGFEVKHSNILHAYIAGCN